LLVTERREEGGDMVRRIILVAGTVAVTAAITSLVVISAAGWTDEQQATGTISVSATTPDLLAICEWNGALPEPCPNGDDSGDDEIVWETDENLLPGSGIVNDHIRLVGRAPSVQWDVTRMEHTFTEVAGTDVADDCFLFPRMTIYDQEGHHGFSNNSVVYDVETGSGFNSWPPGSAPLHVSGLAVEDMFFDVQIPASFPVQCQGVEWDVSIQFTAEIH
jgi:hypothetical protein